MTAAIRRFRSCLFEVVAPYGPVTVLPSPNGRDYGYDYDFGRGGLEIRWTEATAAEVHAVRARRTLFVTVRVVDAKGAPAAGIRVRRTLVLQNSFVIDIMWAGSPSEAAVTDAAGEVVFASSMDRFDVLVEARPPITRQFQSRLLNGPIVITLR
jgi:hypothetical protein